MVHPFIHILIIVASKQLTRGSCGAALGLCGSAPSAAQRLMAGAPSHDGLRDRCAQSGKTPIDLCDGEEVKEVLKKLREGPSARSARPKRPNLRAWAEQSAPSPRRPAPPRQSSLNRSCR